MVHNKNAPVASRSYRPWSYSRLTALETCLRRFWLHYIQGIKGDPTEAMVLGKERHALFAGEIKYAINRNPDVSPAPTLSATDRIAFTRIKSFITGGEFKTEIFLAVDEDGQKADDKNKKEKFLLGWIDATNGRNLIIDWKMGDSMFHDMAQLDIYAILVNAWYGRLDPVLKGAFIFPYADPELEEVHSASTEYFPGEIHRDYFLPLKEKILALEAVLAEKDPLNKDEWEPNPNACKTCLEWASCDVYNRPAETQTGAIIKFPAGALTPKTAPTAIANFMKMKELTDQIEKMLRAYAKKHGATHLGDGSQFGFYEKPDREVKDVRTLIQAVAEAGVEKDDYWNALGLSPTQAEKLLAGVGLDPADYIATKTKTRFGLLPNN